MSEMVAKLWSSLASLPWPSVEVRLGIGSALMLLLALVLSLPNGKRHRLPRRGLALAAGAVGLVLLWWFVPRLETLTSEARFWVWAVITLVSAAAMISSQSPVYSAIWFAVSLLGTAGLLLLQEAQFLGVATVAVYAGAIVVTFLFVLMLAQPQGDAFYDRVSWGPTIRLVASLTAVLFVLLIGAAVTHPDRNVIEQHQAVLAELRRELSVTVPTAEARAVRYESWRGKQWARISLAVPHEQRESFEESTAKLEQKSLRYIRRQHPTWQIDGVQFDIVDLKTADHTAHLGARLFTQRLVAVQAAAALLMAALVGAIAISGRDGALGSVSGSGSDDGASGNGASSDGASNDGASESGASESGALESGSGRAG